MPSLRPLHSNTRLTESQIASAQFGMFAALLGQWLHETVPDPFRDSGTHSRLYLLEEDLPRMLSGRGSALRTERVAFEAGKGLTTEEQMQRALGLLKTWHDKRHTSVAAVLGESAALVEQLERLQARLPAGDSFGFETQSGGTRYDDKLRTTQHTVHLPRLREGLEASSTQLKALIETVQDVPRLLRQRRALPATSTRPAPR